MSLFHLSIFRNFFRADVRGLVRFARRRLNEERLPQVAGSLTFTTVLALVPLLTIVFAVFTTFPLFENFRASLEAYFIRSLMPPAIASTILGYLNQFASKASQLSVIGAIGVILTAIVMLLTIDRAFNQIWRVKRERPISQRVMVYWAILTFGPLLIGVSLTVTSDLFAATRNSVDSTLVGTLANSLISVALMTAAFTLLYIGVPNRRVDWRDAACGGLLAAIAFELAKGMFVVFIREFPAYTVIYGTVAAVPLFLLWIYVSWLVTLIGAVLAAALPIVRHERWWHVPAPGSAFIDAMAVLEVLHAARQRNASSAVDMRAMRSKTRIGFDELEALLEKMLDAGWVGRVHHASTSRLRSRSRTKSMTDSWALLAHPGQLKLADVYRLFVFSPASNPGLAKQVEAAVERGLGQSLAEYFEAVHFRTMPAPSASASTSPSRP